MPKYSNCPRPKKSPSTAGVRQVYATKRDARRQKSATSQSCISLYAAETECRIIKMPTGKHEGLHEGLHGGLDDLFLVEAASIGLRQEFLGWFLDIQKKRIPMEISSLGIRLGNRAQYVKRGINMPRLGGLLGREEMCRSRSSLSRPQTTSG
jgi:hypothetical protein